MKRLKIKTLLAKMLQKESELTTAKNNLKSTVLSYVYPVGSIYISTSSTSPATFIGGTWQRITGRFLLAATDSGASSWSTSTKSSSIKAGVTGGESDHQLVASEMPKHTHLAGKNASREASGYGLTATAAFQNRVYVSGNSETSGEAGSNGTHNTMPPFLSVYMWKRTA